MIGATGVLVSAYIHFYLYFWGGYRGISIDRITGLDISRSFALNAVAGLVIVELLVMAWWLRRFERVAALLGVLFARGRDYCVRARADIRTAGVHGERLDGRGGDRRGCAGHRGGVPWLVPGDRVARRRPWPTRFTELGDAVGGRRNFDEAQLPAVGILDPAFDETPGHELSRLANHDPLAHEPSRFDLDVVELEPDPDAVTRCHGRAAGQLQEPTTEEVDDAGDHTARCVLRYTCKPRVSS